MDADDIALPQRLARQADFLDAHPEVAVVGGAMIVVDQNGRRSSIVGYPLGSVAIRGRLRRECCLAHPTVMLRRSALEAVGGYRFRYAEDYDLWLRLSERFKLANLPEPLVLYRRHPAQISVRGLDEQGKWSLAIRAAAHARRSGRPDPLDGVEELGPETLERLGIGAAELARAAEEAHAAWAAMLAELADRARADRPEIGLPPAPGTRAARDYAADAELREAATLARLGHVLASAAHLVAAWRLAPGHSLRRLAGWFRQRLGRRLSMRP